MGAGFPGRRNLQRNALVCLLGAVLLLFAISFFGRLHKERAMRSSPAPLVIKSLPPDVDGVLRGFRLRQNIGAASIDISGKEAVFRGRKIMVFRSNLAKTTFVEGIKGSIKLKERSITFTADNGEWNTTRDSPLTLAHNVHLTVNGEDIPDVQLAKINFTTQRVEVEGSKKGVYPF